MKMLVRLALLVSFALGCYAQNTLVYNPFTRKLDYTGSGGGGSGTVSNCATVGSLGYYSASGTTITCVGADYIFNTHTLTLAATAIFDAAANSAQVKVVTKSQADNSTNAASTAYVDTGLATKVAKFFGTAAPGSVAGNLPGDIYSDTTNHVLYWCNAPSATAAPACTSVTSGGWTAVNGSFASSVDATKFGAVCDGSTDDTAAFTAMSALAVNIYIPAGKTCSILNPTWSSHTHIWGGPNSGLIRGSGTTGSYMLTASSKTDVGLHNLIIDGNSVTQTTANLYYVFLTGTSNWVVENCTFQNTGSPPASMGGITEFNGSGVIRSNTFKSTILGQQINVDSNSTATNRVQILNNSLNGSTTGGIWVQNSGSEGVCPVEVAGNLISNVGDSAADAGQTGNGIKVYQCDYADVHDNVTDTTRYSGIRVTTSSWNDIHDNTIKAASESAMYCSELGGANNHCHGNHIFNSMSGIDATNVSSRSPDATNKIDNNDCTNVAYYCVYGEHDVVANNRADGVPFPFIIGHGATSHDNVLKSNFCTLSSASYYPIDVCAGIDVGMVGTSTVSGNLYAGLTAITVTPVIATNTPSNIVVTAITQASPAAVTYSSGTQPANNSTVCFAQVAGMTQINGLCGTVSSSTGTTFSVAINASAFSAFLATPANGTSPKAQAIEVYSSGTTPYQAFTTHVAMTNQSLAFAYLSTMANGSSVYLTDGTVGSTCAGSGTGSAAVLNNGTWSCFGAVGLGDPGGNGIVQRTALNTTAVATAHNIAAPLACSDSSGSGTAQSCTTSPSFTPATGDTLIYKTTTTNTGDVTVNVNSTSAAHIKKWSNAATLASGDLVANIPVLLTYDGTAWEIETIGNAPAGGGSGQGPNGVNAQTVSYLLVSGDNNKMVTENGSNLTATLPASPPSSTWTSWILNLNSTALTIARNSLTINGVAANLSLLQGQAVRVYTDGSNYFVAVVGNAVGTGIIATCTAQECTLSVDTSYLNTNYKNLAGAVDYAAGGGTAQAQTASYAASLTALFSGLELCWLPTAANTGAGPTFSPNSLTAHTIVKQAGAALIANDLITTAIACARYDATGTQWELQDPQTSASGTPSFPLTVAGTVTSGGIPYFNSTTQESSSALLTQYGVLFGGGVGGTPTSSAQGGTNFPLIGQGAANPIFSTIAYPTSLTSGGFLYASSTTAFASSALLATNTIPKSGGAGAAPVASSVIDNGTTVTSTDTGGYVAPVFVANGATAGFVDFPQGSTSAAVAPCNTATSICEQAPAAVTAYVRTMTGSAAQGTRLASGTSAAIQESYSGDAAHALTQTSKTALISTATLCAATAGTACGQVGQYRISYNFWGSGTACSSVTAGSVGLNFTWTDENAQTHTTVSAPMFDQKAATTGILFNFNTALTTEAAGGSFVISTNGTIIQYATTYTACTTGTGTYNLRLTIEPLQ